MYKKLYQYLDKALLASATSLPRIPASTSTATTAATTKARAQTYTQPSPNSTRSAHKKRKPPNLEVPPPPPPTAAEDGTLPSWAGAAIKHICRAAGLPSALPHVFAGVHTLLRSAAPATPSPPAQKRRRTASSTHDAHAHAAAPLYTTASIPALLSAVLVVVAQRLAAGLQDAEGVEAAVAGVESEALISTAVYELVQLGHLAPADVDAVLDATDAFLDEQAHAWRRMEWWTNIVSDAADADALDAGAVDGSDADELARGAVASPRRAGVAAQPSAASSSSSSSALADMRYGLGSMKQEAVDWLSESRRASYRVWERMILAEIAAVELEAGDKA